MNQNTNEKLNKNVIKSVTYIQSDELMQISGNMNIKDETGELAKKKH